MPNSSVMATFRDGNWSIPSNVEASPWYSSNQAELAATPDTAGTDDDTGYTVLINHDITIDKDVIIGGSFPQAPWSPPIFSATDGSVVTNLPTGAYRATYAVVSSQGISTWGNSETGIVSITNGVSKPRVTFPSAPPPGCWYNLFLTSTDGKSGWETDYCVLITGTTVDLVGGLYHNSYSGGLAVGGTGIYNIYLPGNRRGQFIYLSNAVTIGPEGRIRLAAGKKLTLRGDFWVDSTGDQTKDYLILGWLAKLVWDSSLAPIPASTQYVLWFAGGGRIQFLGPG